MDVLEDWNKIREKWVRWLWLTKIKSRFCFCTILEFINIQRPEFKSVLILMQPIGAAFYEAYVMPSAQYNNHDFDLFIRVGMHEMLYKCLSASKAQKAPASFLTLHS
jgi:hypothetical protein